MSRLRRSRMHKGIKDFKKKHRTRRRAMDIDQIQETIQKAAQVQMATGVPQLPVLQTANEDEETRLERPGLGQFYCVECARHMADAHALTEHKRGKLHKKRVKLLKEPMYTQREAEQAAGLGVANHVISTA